MAEIIQGEGQGKKKGKKRAKKHGTHIDMTPMVDLACLLLTFFMLTTAFNKPKVMEIVLPEKPKVGDPLPPPVNKGRAVNIILVNHDKILWYNGLADPRNLPLPTLNETDFSKDGIRKVLLHRNKDLYLQIAKFEKEVKEGKITLPKDTIEARIRRMGKDDQVGPIVLIKSGDSVKYRNVVDIIDEMAICNVVRYALVDINSVEKKMVADYFNAQASGAATKIK
jgi:biopolymer transport protein ExbD